MAKNLIPEATVRRLSLYLRCLERLRKDGRKVVSSSDLSCHLKTTDAQVRRDLAYFGGFGKRGFGYEVDLLISKLGSILGLHRRRKVALIGAGKLGLALAAYPGFKRRNFEMCRIFDNAPEKIGRVWEGVEIQDVSLTDKVMKEEQIEIGIIATPAEAAQHVAERLAKAGVKAILNFAPIRISAPDSIIIKNVDLTLELENVSYHLNRR